MKDPSAQLNYLLSQVGQESIFSVMSEPQCEELIQRLETHYQQEEVLSAEIQDMFGCEPSRKDAMRRTPPHGLPGLSTPGAAQEPPIGEPSTSPLLGASRQARRVAVFCTFCALFLVGWSATLYQWAYQRGVKQGTQRLASTTPPASQQVVQPVAHQGLQKVVIPPLKLKAPKVLRTPYLSLMPLQWEKKLVLPPLDAPNTEPELPPADLPAVQLFADKPMALSFSSPPPRRRGLLISSTANSL